MLAVILAALVLIVIHWPDPLKKGRRTVSASQLEIATAADDRRYRRVR